jgi:hypothetical protein
VGLPLLADPPEEEDEEPTLTVTQTYIVPLPTSEYSILLASAEIFVSSEEAQSWTVAPLTTADPTLPTFSMTPTTVIGETSTATPTLTCYEGCQVHDIW